jgi:hypothetical protein
MKKIFEFGKIAWYGSRKINAVEVEVEWKENNHGKMVFSVCGTVWNATHTDCVCAGQCLDEILPYLKWNKKFKEIHRLWKSYHLNDMHIGTREQENALNEAVKVGKIQSRSAYTECCEYLKSIGLYEVELNGKTYEYGHGWIYYDIPQEDINKIEELFKEV